MWHDIVVIEKITMTQRINILLYYLKMLPIIGKKLPEHWYASLKFKHVCTILAFLLDLFSIFLRKGLYIALFIILPAQIMCQEQEGRLFCIVFIYLILNGIAGPFMLDTMTHPARKEFVMIQLMHMGAKRYVYANWIIYALLHNVMLLLCLLVLFATNAYPMYYPFLLIAISFIMRLSGNVFQLYFAQKKEKPLGLLYNCLVFILTYGVAFGGAYWIRNDVYTLPVVITMLVIVLVNALCMIRIEKRMQYEIIMRKMMNINRSVIEGTLQKDAFKKDVEIRDRDISAQDLKTEKFNHKKGYAYLNALFFHRHKHLFYKPMRNRMIGIVLVFVCANIFVYFLRDVIPILSNPYVLLPGMVFVMYAISIGERVTRAMFYNCDVSLLHFGYYRTPSAILENFTIRLRKIIFLNSILTTLISVGCLSIMVCMQISFPLFEIALFILTLYSISIFFSVHHLCMYYLLQPYTGELEMKSPMFAVVSGIVYFVSYMAMRLDGTFQFTLIVLGATILYSVVALLLIWKKAPTTFHIR